MILWDEKLQTSWRKNTHIWYAFIFVALRSIFLCSCSIHLTLQVIKKTSNPTYLCTCFDTSQYLVSLNTLQQTHNHKENSMTKKKRQNIQNCTLWLLDYREQSGWVLLLVFCLVFFHSEMLELSSDLCFFILKKLQCSAWLFITYQQASHVSVHKFSYNTHMVLLSKK